MIRSRLITCALLAAALTLEFQNRVAADDTVQPKTTPAVVSVEVTVDTSEVPSLADWGKKAKKLVESRYPKVAAMLPSKGFTPPSRVTIVFKKEMKGIAFASGTTITISGQWIERHPDDFGMVVHEMTHIVQSYRRVRRGGAGWLVEGIADYIRFFHYEPKTKVKVNSRRASYRDGYRTCAKFLSWIEKTHDKDIVRKLNEALRQGTYKDDLFTTYTSKTLDELWASFIASLDKK